MRKILKKNPRDYTAAAEVMWAGSLSHNGLTGCGGSGGDWAVHQIEHELSGLFDVAHGAGLASVWNSWAEYVVDVNPVRFAELGRQVFGISYDAASAKKAAGETINKMKAFFESIDMPTSISALGFKVTGEQIKEMAWKATFFGTRTTGAFKSLGAADIEAIYTAAK